MEEVWVYVYVCGCGMDAGYDVMFYTVGENHTEALRSAVGVARQCLELPSSLEVCVSGWVGWCVCVRAMWSPLTVLTRRERRN